MPDKKPLILHPFILAVYPILFYYNLNKNEILFSETLMPMAISLIAILLLLLFLKFIFKKTTKAGILLSLILLLFYSYEAIHTDIALYKIGDFVLGVDPNLFWSYGILFTLSTIGLCFWSGKHHKVTEYLNVVSVVLIAFPIIGLASYKMSSEGYKLFPSNQPKQVAIADNFNYAGPKPDIYYIILDAYMRDDVMNEFWGFNNSEFINSLESRGFYVVPKSRSNYQQTIFSLASSLNMEYLPTDLGVDSPYQFNKIHLIETIEKNRVVNFLKSLGYLYVHLSDNAAETKMNGQADIVITNRKYTSFFSQYLLSKTILKKNKFFSLNPVQDKRDNIIYGFNELEEIPKKNIPTFTFAHFLMPHSPQAFDENGGIPIQSTPAAEKYFNEVLYANKKINQLVDYILANSEKPPIILIQGDHGALAQAAKIPNTTQIKKSYSNLSAYYLPGTGKDKLYESITPANSFRLIFDHYFGTQLGLLEDISYYSIPHTFWSAKFSRPKESSGARKFIPIPDEDLLFHGPSAWTNSLEKTILEKPDFVEAHIMLGKYYAELQRFPEAIAAWEKALYLDSDSTWAYIFLADHYIQVRNFSMALKIIQRAISVNPNVAENHALLGQVSLFLKDKEKALSSYEKAALISPSSFNYNNLGSAYDIFGLNEEAKLNWKKSVKINPRNHEAYFNLGRIFSETKGYEEAIKFYQKAIEQKPDYLKVFYNLGIIYSILNKTNEAIEYYQKVLALNPNHMLAHFALGNVLLKSNKPESALFEYKKAIKLNPDHIPSIVNLGHTLFILGQSDQAQNTYKTILLKQPNIPEVHKSLGLIYSQKKENPDKAIHHFQEYLRLSPNQHDATQINFMIQSLKIEN